jgi:hypothetical protein
MGLIESGKALFTGHPKDAFNYLWLPDETITSARDNDSQLLNNIQRLQSQALISHDQFLGLYQQISTNTLDDKLLKGANTPYDVFEEGAMNDVGSTLKGLPTNLANLIPWYIWVLAFALVTVWAWPIVGPAVNSFMKKGVFGK